MILLCTIRLTELKNIDKNSNKTFGVMDCSSWLVIFKQHLNKREFRTLILFQALLLKLQQGFYHSNS